MKCQQCDKPATFHITELTGGKPQELHLCEDHARQYLTSSAGAASAPRVGSRRPAAARWRATTCRSRRACSAARSIALDADDPARADLALDWCEALLAAGDVGPAAAAIDELGRFSADSERLRAWHTCFAGQLTVLTAPQALHATADAVAAAADELAALGDAAGEAKAHFVHAQALARLGRVGACEAALDRALAAARRAGDRRRANTVLAGRTARRALGSESGDARQRPLPRRRARAAHHAGRAGRRGRRPLAARACSRRCAAAPTRRAA